VTTAEEMHSTVTAAMADATIFIGAAAVSDYRVRNVSESKIKKTAPELELKLERTPDILAEVARLRSNRQLIIGFAAETNDVLANARKKLTAKNLDMIVANDVSRSDAGFDSEANAVTIILNGQSVPIELPLMSKFEVAHRILDEIVKLRHSASAAKTA
jgi:phosphopantothenoylcysteine decarboxylase / phosphopantothenate---cysteine ligase